jgi:hypothetical protein
MSRDLSRGFPLCLVAFASERLEECASNAPLPLSVHAGLAPLVLPHLSEQCNDSEIALTSMCDAVARTSLQGAVTAASQGVRK